MQSNSERFVYIYNQLDDWMRTQLKAKQHISHATMIDQLAGQNAYVKKYQSRLHAFRSLRNALVHWTSPSEGTSIAEPHTDVVDEYAKILGELETPPCVLSKAIVDVYTVSWSTPIIEILQTMVPNSWRLAPVVEDDHLVGLFDMSVAIAHIKLELEREGRSVITTHTTLAEWSDLVRFSPQNPRNQREKTPFVQGVALVSEATSVLDVERLFQAYFDRNELVSVVCVTRNGTAFEPLLGIVTAHDVTLW